MARNPHTPLSAGTQVYILAVVCAGLLAIALSVHDLAQQPLKWHLDWLQLAGLTLLSGWLSVKLPQIAATISISETFVFAGALLFGPAVGTILVVLDALLMCTKEELVFRRLRWQQVVFNITAPALSIWLACKGAGITEQLEATKLNREILTKLAVFTFLYFLLNSWFVTFVVALQKHARPFPIWWTNFKHIFINFLCGASIAAFLVNAREIGLAYVALLIVPLLLVIYLTYLWSTKRVEAERAKHEELNRVFLSTIEALALAIDAKDQVTHGHIRRVQRFTMALAEALGVKDEKQLDALRAAALLHDTGKLAVPEYILNKPGPLTATEFEKMKVHAAVGADILKSIEFPYPVEPIVRHHHENWDGTGYPEGLKGQAIPLGARVLSVVDCYDALTSDRPYRPRYPREQAEQVLRERRGVMYDPWVVDGFLKILDQLEKSEALQNGQMADKSTAPHPAAPQLAKISATTAEDREFNELRRDLPKAASIEAAADVLFRHLRRVVPAATFALFMPKKDTTELHVIACSGVGSSAIQGLVIAIGERISGFAYAHKQSIVNSDATLELGPVARTFSVPLRYAIAVPMLDRNPLGVISLYGSEPFDNDHRRMLEGAATLFVSSAPFAALAAPGSGPMSPRSDAQLPATEASPDHVEPPKNRIH